MSEQIDLPNQHEGSLNPINQIQQIIEEARNKESLRITRVPLFRAITGRGKSLNGQWLFEGVEEDRLRKYGFFESNGSAAQFGYDTTSISSDEFNPMRRVPGLPVFLDLSEALLWLKGKKFLGQPAIAVLDLPLSAYSGPNQEVRLMKNFLITKMQDLEITPEELKRHLEGAKAIRGECYLRGLDPNIAEVPASVKQHQIIIRPSQLNEDGSINISSGFEEFQTQT